MKKKSNTRELVLAIIEGDMDRVREMHAAGVPIDQPDQYGWLPIHRAAANNRDAIISLLVQWGSPLEPRGTEGWTPLHLASVSSSARAVTALLAAGADITARSVYGATPLHLAIHPTVTEGLLQTIRALISAGASLHTHDGNGKTPLDEAAEIKNSELQTILKGAG